MVDPAEAISKAREAIGKRADLPGMSLIEHLEELRKRIVHSAIYLALGFGVAYYCHTWLYGLVQAPLDRLGIKLNFTHPMDALNLYLQVALIGGAILASPFILYQVCCLWGCLFVRQAWNHSIAFAQRRGGLLYGEPATALPVVGMPEAFCVANVLHAFLRPCVADPGSIS